jgi:hypothetical protein
MKEGRTLIGFGSAGDAVPIAATVAGWRKEQDDMFFRVMLSPERGDDRMDLEAHTREVMAGVERDLGTRLEWVAVSHYNTDNRHVHVVIRGLPEDGSALSGLDLSNLRFEGVNLDGSNLSNTRNVNTTYESSSLDGANFSNATFSNSTIKSAGENLVTLRHSHDLKFRDVHEATKAIAARHGFADFAISPGRLKGIEGGEIPSLYKLYSLSVVYDVGLGVILSWYRIPSLAEEADVTLATEVKERKRRERKAFRGCKPLTGQS